MKKLVVMLFPFAVLADDFDTLKAEFAATQDAHRRAAIVGRANTPAVSNEVRTVTNAVPADIVQAAQQISLMLTNFAAIVAQTGVDYAKISGYAKTHASELTGDQLSKLQAMDELWKDVSPFAPQGLASFRAVTTNTVTVPVQGPSPAMQRLGRAATAEDFK